MKRYFIITMTLKAPRSMEEELTISGRYIVEKEEELDAHAGEMADGFHKTKDDFEVSYKETSLQEFIKAEEDDLRRYISRAYLDRNQKKYPYLPAKEYLDILNHLEEEVYYKILLQENALRRIDRFIRRKIGSKKLSLAEYDALRLSLLYAKTEEDFEKAFDDLKKPRKGGE